MTKRATRIHIYNRWLATLGGGEKYALSMAVQLARMHAVHVISHEPVDKVFLADRLDLDLSAVEFVTVPAQAACDLGPVSSRCDVFINASHGDIIPAQAPHNVLLVFFPVKLRLDLASRWRRRVGLAVKRLLPRAARELIFSRYWLTQSQLSEWNLRLNSIPKRLATFEDLDTYSSIWAISEFTRKWIGAYWNRPSVVLYPPVATHRLAPSTKQNQILSVGRFFAGSHNKKHLVMMLAFKKMVDQGLAGWTLHLAGQVTPGAEHQRYFEQVRAQCTGYPIVVHTDISSAQLATLYGESAIYWHASGFGDNVDVDPIKFEHFGISTVEAMAAGCVPVVIGSGGQPEIVQHGENGFLWQSLDELNAYSWQVIRDLRLRTTVAQNAVKRSDKFGVPAFGKHLDDLCDLILNPSA